MKRSVFISCIILIILIIGCGQDRPYLDTAIKAANWLAAVKIETEDGTVWPVDPEDSMSVVTNLYSGYSGVVLFLLELYHTTGNPHYLQLAKAGSDCLIRSLPEDLSPQTQTGLYTGIAGIGFVLEEAYQACNESSYREKALHCVALLHQSAEKTDHGVHWNHVTDIISGSSGIGLFLLYAAEKMDHKPSSTLAIQAGNYLIKQGIMEKNGLKWPMSQNYPRLMPNFSHGTAGVCYFLLSLYERTDQKEFFDTALQGANYLLTITNDQGLIFHHEPGGEDLCYLGWCHGPPGTSRLYYQLWKITQDDKWLTAIKKSTQGILDSGIPEQKTDGFWNNISQCCGNAGVADYFLNLYKITNNHEYLDFAEKLTQHLIKQATVEKNGLKWIQAEHRTQPEFLVAQTGFMQGAAGVGMWLLKLDAFFQKKQTKIRFPDSPY